MIYRLLTSDYPKLLIPYATPTWPNWNDIVIADLGHEDPTFLLTNQLKRSAPKLINRYAQRMIIENNIEDGIDFFHMDALSSAVAMKVNFDLQLTLMASSLYRLLSSKIANGYQNAKSRHIFRDFIDATGKRDPRSSLSTPFLFVLDARYCSTRFCGHSPFW